MKKWIAGFALLAAASLALQGALWWPYTAQEKLTITAGGACGAEWSMTVLLEAFTFDNVEVTATYSATNSLYGIQGVKTGVLDLGTTTFLPEDMPEGLAAVPYAAETISVLVNTQNPVRSLTTQQLRAIATGEIRSWKELGGEDAPICFYGRREGSGMRHSFETALNAVGECRYEALFSGSGSIAAEVARNPYAIGYTSTVPLNTGVVGVVLDGAGPTPENLASGSYPISQTFYLVWDERQDKGEIVKHFLDFFYRDDLGVLLARTGAIEIPRQA